MNIFFVSVITGSQIIALIIARPFMGRISDKAGRRTPIIAGSVISGLLLLMFPLTARFPLLLFLSIGYGLGFAMVISSTSPFICDLVPSTLIGSSLGFLATMMDTGQFLGPIVSGVILLSSLHYIALFYSLSGLLILSCITFIFSQTGKK